MPASVAIRAEKITFRRFSKQFFPGAVEAAEREPFRSGIPVVKLEGGDAHVVAAVFATTATRFDQPPLALEPPLPLVAVPRISPTLPSIRIDVVTTRYRLLRGVVRSERRACETELPAIERSQFAFDQLLCRKLNAALLTCEHLARLWRIEAGAVSRSERSALQTQSSALQMATLTFDDRVIAES